jgi:hypothetical protein
MQDDESTPESLWDFLPSGVMGSPEGAIFLAEFSRQCKEYAKWQPA